MTSQIRKPSISMQLEVFFRDKWLCHVCRRPLVFVWALKHLAQLAEDSMGQAPAYYHTHWRRDSAPLLDELGASIDYCKALAKGSSNEIQNLAAICWRCNTRKTTSNREAFIASTRSRKLKGQHGEPVLWDGLTSVFLALASKSSRPMTGTEEKWFNGLQAYHSAKAANTPKPKAVMPSVEGER